MDYLIKTFLKYLRHLNKFTSLLILKWLNIFLETYLGLRADLDAAEAVGTVVATEVVVVVIS